MRGRGLWWSIALCLLIGIVAVGRNADPQMLGALSNGSPNGVALSADGTMLAVATALGVELRTAGDWTITRFLTDNEGAVTSVAFSPDGKHLAAGSRDEAARIWRVETGELLHTLPHENRHVTAVAFSADGTMLATGAVFTQICLWKTETGESLGCLAIPNAEASPDAEVKRLVFSPDGRTLAAELDDGSLYWWDLSSRRLLGIDFDWVDPLRCAGFLDDGESIVGISRDGTVFAWDVATAEMVGFSLPSPVTFVTTAVIDSTGNWMAIGMEQGRLVLNSARSGTHQLLSKTHTGDITAVALSGDGATMATVGEDCRVRIWDTETQVLEAELRDYGGLNMSSAFSADGRYLVCEVSVDGLLDVWDLETERNIRSLQVTPPGSIMRPLAVSPDGQWVAAGTQSRRREGEVDVLRLADGESAFLSMAPDPDVGALAVSPDGGLLAIASYRNPGIGAMLWDASIQVIETTSGDPIWTAENDHSEPHFILFSHDGQLVVANAASALGLWSSENGEFLRTFGEAARAAMLSHDGSVLSTATWADSALTTARYRLETGELLETYVHKISGLMSVAFSPDGELVAAGTSQESVYVWATETGELVDEFEPCFGTGVWPAYGAYPWSLAFSPDGGTLVVGLSDGTILRWGLAALGASGEGD